MIFRVIGRSRAEPATPGGDGSTEGRAFDSWFLPLIGFVVLPWTTLAFAVMWDVGTHQVTGFEWFVVGLAFLADLGTYGGGRRARS